MTTITRGVRLNEGQIQQVRAEFRRTGNANEAALRLGINASTVNTYVRDLRANADRFLEGDLSWQDQAACAGHPVETFFPTGGGDRQWIKEAKDICARCPVIEACGEYAKRTNSQGVWGGKYLGYRGHRDGAEKVA